MIPPPAVQKFITESLGMADDAVGKSVLSRAVAQAMRREGLSDPAAYEKIFLASADVRQHFVDAVVVGETWFFRDRGPFAYLGKNAVGLWQCLAGETLDILSAPCSTGEEPYSIAMTLLAAGLPASAFRIDAVDISTEALDKARRADYESSSFRGNIGPDVAPYFEATPNGRRVARHVAKQVSFHLDNLVQKTSLAGRGPYAVIFCRNLLIYLTPQARQNVFERLNRLLRPGGLIFAGHTETVFWHQQGYTPIQSERAFALAKPAGAVGAPKYTTGQHEKAPVMKEISRAGTTRAAAAKPAEVVSPAPVLAPERKEKTIPGKFNGTHEQLQEARRLADKGDMEGALRLCRGYHKTAGPSAEMYGLQGIICMAQKDFANAEECFVKALYLDPDHYESLVHMSLLCRQKGDGQKADLYRKRAERLANEEDKNKKTSDIFSGAKVNRMRTDG